MAETKLKPCPFCGESPVLVRSSIWCNCGADMTQENQVEAIAAWNRRTDDER